MPKASWQSSVGQKLITASLRGNRDEVIRLLDDGADINFKNANGWTALRWACYYRHFEMVTLCWNATPMLIFKMDGELRH
jgi:ankyrin repeat protein